MRSLLELQHDGAAPQAAAEVWKLAFHGDDKAASEFSDAWQLSGKRALAAHHAGGGLKPSHSSFIRRCVYHFRKCRESSTCGDLRLI
mmetsp:Transcript_55161/g.131450  ORF Transcript_55161/g.131450 Transcript_55161/m.131450 type:complete len:87 (-) Transcript_55161:4-264(-)